MRLLVTGARGQLGRDVVAAGKRAGHSVHGVSHRECDIAEPGAVAAALVRTRADAVINCAGWTKVDAAESNADGAYRANAIGPRILAAACTAAGALLCHVSTDFVFDGAGSSPIDEWASTHPLGVYGASKLAGEYEVREHAARHQVVRTSWLFGNAGPNFVLTMLRLARSRDALRVVADQVGAPTWTGHLAPALIRLVERGTPGLYHLTNSGAATWHDLAATAVAEAGIVNVAIHPITTAEYPTPVRRPPYSVLDNRAWRLLGEAPLPDWRVAVQAYVALLKSEGCAAAGHDHGPR